MDIFSFDDESFYKIRYEKLQRKNNIEYELSYQSNFLTNKKKMIIKTIVSNGRTIIVYRDMYDLPESEEYTIQLHLRIITLNGVIHPEPTLLATIFDDIIELGDVKIFGENQNKGYGSILMNCLKELATKYEINVIAGFIAETDNDHIDRITHFYKKHDFIFNGNTINWSR